MEMFAFKKSVYLYKKCFAFEKMLSLEMFAFRESYCLYKMFA